MLAEGPPLCPAVRPRLFRARPRAESALLLGKLIHACPRLVLPYVPPILKALVAKLRTAGPALIAGPAPPGAGANAKGAAVQGGPPGRAGRSCRGAWLSALPCCVSRSGRGTGAEACDPAAICPGPCRIVHCVGV